MADELKPEEDSSANAAPVEPPDGIPQIGAVIAGKYQVEKMLGMGGMGVVVAARHMELGELVAVKFLFPRASRDPEAVARFMREAKVTVRIKTEHIARVLDIGKLESGPPYILMEHLVGMDLAQLLKMRGPLPFAEAIDYVLQASVAIAEAHALGIVHRDLKPSNLFLTARSDGSPLVKVLDLGISKMIMLGESGAKDVNLTDTSAVFGSPMYMSPEQVRSAKRVDVRTDLWALGVILYELLAGDTPFSADGAAGLLAAIVADAPVPLRAKRTDVPGELEAVVMRCLEKDVTRRFQSIAEVVTALAPMATGGSQISVERVLRLSAGSGAGSLPPPQPSSSSLSAYAATDKAWTRMFSAPPTKGRSRTILVGGGALCIVGVVSALAFSRPAPTPTPGARLPPSATTEGPIVAPVIPVRIADAGTIDAPGVTPVPKSSSAGPKPAKPSPAPPLAVPLRGAPSQSPVPPASPIASPVPASPLDGQH